jgi:hypothetical protein
MTASLTVYWALRLMNLSPLFWVWPLAALLRHVIGLSRRRLRTQDSSIAGHHWCLLALLIAQFGLLAFLRGFYANLARHADGTMTLDASSSAAPCWTSRSKIPKPATNSSASLQCGRSWPDVPRQAGSGTRKS